MVLAVLLSNSLLGASGAFENLAEAPEADLWTRWLMPEFPAEKVAPLGGELTYQFRQSMGRRVVVENGNRYLNKLIHVTVTKVLQTAAGRMIFARPEGKE